MNKVVNFISSSILCLIPVALLTGPFLPDLFISFLALFFLIFTISNKKYFYYNNIYFKFFILFCIYFIIGSYFSENPRLSFSSSLFYFRFGLFVLMTKYLLECLMNHGVRTLYTTFQQKKSLNGIKPKTLAFRLLVKLICQIQCPLSNIND